MSSLGYRIKTVRKNNKLSQKEFAEKICVSASYVSKLESDKETPTEMLLKLISLEFNISYFWLKNETDEYSISEKKYDYFERNNLESIRLALIKKLSEIIEKIQHSDISQMDLFLCDAISQVQILSENKELNDNIKPLIFDNFMSIFNSYSELISNLVNLDKHSKSYQNEIFRNVRLITVDIEEKLIEIGNHFTERNK